MIRYIGKGKLRQGLGCASIVGAVSLFDQYFAIAKGNTVDRTTHNIMEEINVANISRKSW